MDTKIPLRTILNSHTVKNLREEVKRARVPITIGRKPMNKKQLIDSMLRVPVLFSHMTIRVKTVRPRKPRGPRAPRKRQTAEQKMISRLIGQYVG